ncbi:hypothetical protein WJX77_004583 [Trebouxia sp. C0004]
MIQAHQPAAQNVSKTGPLLLVGQIRLLIRFLIKQQRPRVCLKFSQPSGINRRLLVYLPAGSLQYCKKCNTY